MRCGRNAEFVCEAETASARRMPSIRLWQEYGGQTGHSSDELPPRAIRLRRGFGRLGGHALPALRGEGGERGSFGSIP